MDLELQGSRAAVTGASKGIGRAIAERLAVEGASVALCARGRDRLEATARDIEAGSNGHCEAIQADLTEPERAHGFVETAVDRLGGLDVLVNNAGSAPHGSLTDLSESDWQRALGLKFMGAVRCMTAAVPHLLDGGGTVVNVVGRAGEEPSPATLTSGAANAAELNFTRALAQQ